MKIFKLFLVFLVCFVLIAPAFAARQYGCTGLTGGTSGTLDSLDITGATTPNPNSLANGDTAFVLVLSGTSGYWYRYVFDADGTDAEASPNIIRPDDFSTAGVWRLVSIASGMLPAASGSSAGTMSAAHYTRVEGVENGATADQTDAEIETAYNNQVGQVSEAEKTAGTETGVRRFSPDDVKDMIDTHGGSGSAADDTPYDATSWDGNTDAATKNAIRDKIETLSGGHDPATLGGSLDYITLSGQIFNLGPINLGTDVTGTLTGSNLVTGTVGSDQIASTAVTPGSYTSANVTIDADGRVTAASNGSGGSLPSGTNNQILQHNGTTWVAKSVIDGLIDDTAGAGDTDKIVSADVVAGKANASHNHAGEDITSGTVADARIPSTIARDSEITVSANSGTIEIFVLDDCSTATGMATGDLCFEY